MIQLIVSEVNPQLSAEELCRCANINELLLFELVEHSIAVPIMGAAAHEWKFNASIVGIVKKATRIHRDLAIDWPDISLVLNLLDQLDELKMENKYLKKQLSRFIDDEEYKT